MNKPIRDLSVAALAACLTATAGLSWAEGGIDGIKVPSESLAPKTDIGNLNSPELSGSIQTPGVEEQSAADALDVFNPNINPEGPLGFRERGPSWQLSAGVRNTGYLRAIAAAKAAHRQASEAPAATNHSQSALEQLLRQRDELMRHRYSMNNGVYMDLLTHLQSDIDNHPSMRAYESLTKRRAAAKSKIREFAICGMADSSDAEYAATSYRINTAQDVADVLKLRMLSVERETPGLVLATKWARRKMQAFFHIGASSQGGNRIVVVILKERLRELKAEFKTMLQQLPITDQTPLREYPRFKAAIKGIYLQLAALREK